MARYNAEGREIPDPTPAEPPAGWRPPSTLQDQIRRLIRTELSQAAEADGFESFEEAEDFDVEEEFDPLSPYELVEAINEGPDDATPIPPPNNASRGLQTRPKGSPAEHPNPPDASGPENGGNTASQQIPPSDPSKGPKKVG